MLSSLRLCLFITRRLAELFSEFGKVNACTIVRDADGKSRGFAILNFGDPASVNAVMTREHFLDGKASVPFLSVSEKFSDIRTPRGLTLNARPHARNTCATRDTSSVDWHHT